MTGESDPSMIGFGSDDSRKSRLSTALAGVPEPPAMDRWWLLVAPLAMGGVYLGLVGAFGSRVLHTGRPWPHGAIAVLLLSSFLLVCLAGTLRLYDDAVALRGSGATWQPNPWHYVVGGAVVLTTARLFQLTVRDAAISRTVPSTVGSFVVALILSSLVAGPVYLVVRRYRLGDS